MLQNALEYFLLSSFVDPRCMNKLAASQGLTAADVKAVPNSIEYALAFAQPETHEKQGSLFIIERRYRKEKNGEQVLSTPFLCHSQR